MSWLERLVGGWGFDSRDGASVVRGDAVRVAEVEAALQTLRPLLAADGGAVELVEVGEAHVVLRWKGSCSSCASAPLTLERGIAPKLHSSLPWLKRIETVR